MIDMTKLVSAITVDGVELGLDSGIPINIKSIASGIVVPETDWDSSEEHTITHNLGEVPDLCFFFKKTKPTTNYTMIVTYYFAYIGRSYFIAQTTSASSRTGGEYIYGLRNVTDTTFTVRAYSSTGYKFAGGEEHVYIAIKLA